MAADLVELRMNVAALKRVDPYIKDILGTATQVALYTFSALKNEWEITDVEGALFVCSRNGEPYNSILIMNRLNTNNLVEPIVKNLDWQMQAPFLLYKNSKNNIHGIWFYNRDECVKITYLVENIMESLNKQERPKPRRQTSGADIFTMLSRAQEDFNKTPQKVENQQPTASTPRAPDVTSQSVMDFFAKASTTKTTHQAPARLPAGDSEPLRPLLHRLMSNPAHSVEHIEKQQRAVTPQELRRANPPRTEASTLQPSTLQSSTLQPSTLQNRNSGVFALYGTSPVSSAPLLENGLNLMRISSPSGSPPANRGFYLQPDEPEPRTVSPPTAPLLDNPQKPALMPPIMFATTGAKEKPDLSTEVSTGGFLASGCSPEQPEPLTRKQMVQAFHYLLKNDPEFVTKLHEAYVKSFAEMVS